MTWGSPFLWDTCRRPSRDLRWGGEEERTTRREREGREKNKTGEKDSREGWMGERKREREGEMKKERERAMEKETAVDWLVDDAKGCRSKYRLQAHNKHRHTHRHT